jgi:hypothetical protein
VLLFSLLASDTLIHYRVRWQGVRPAVPGTASKAA